MEVSPRTGSLLIRYDENQLEPELLFAAVIRLLGLERELEKTPQPVLIRELGAILRSLDRAVSDRTRGLLDFRSGLFLGLAALGIAQMLSRNEKMLPPGFQLLWWAYMGLSQEIRRADR